MNNYPVILAHGIARFDAIRQSFINSLAQIGLPVPPVVDALHYFKGVASHLAARGFDAYQTEVDFAAGVEVRAAKLKTEVERVINRSGRSKVHIIAHSMGGLDARHMIVGHGMSDKIASLTTIGTPHNGTPLAEAGLEAFGSVLVEKLRPWVHLEGFVDLTMERCLNFNAEAEADEAENDVFYQTYAASEARELIFAPLQLSWDVIWNSPDGGENDGLVPRSSQLWKETLKKRDGGTKEIARHSFPFSADHLNEIGWFDFNQFRSKPPFTVNPVKFMLDYELNVRNVYAKIAAELRQL